jgi:transcriptional regulator with XRE-family HTH domain
MKTRERNQARRLRREDGKSIKEIARLVGVSVSSVSLWVRDIELTEAQVEALRLRNCCYNRQFAAWKANAERARVRRRRYQDEGRRLARLGVANHAAGVMLYWAEGDKSNRNSVRLSNADPHVVRFFLDFLREYFNVPNDRVRITCHLFSDHLEHQRAIEQFWLDFLALPRSRLCPSVVTSIRSTARRNAGTSCRMELAVWSFAKRASFRASSGRSRSTAASIGPSGSANS